jgi:mannitol/fructose-specific phosphotransferase system IIA component (Ntr-type)
MAISLVDLLDERDVALQLRARKPANAVRQIIQLMAESGKLSRPEEFLEAVLAREQINLSTVENGVAFPHARTDLVNEIVLGIGRSRSGIPFRDGKRARLIFVIGVPQRLVNDYLICLGTLARILQDDLTRAALLEAETPRNFLDALLNG